MQIVIDDNNVVLQCSIGGLIDSGIEVDNIPDEVFSCPDKWIYAAETDEDGISHAVYSLNDDYIEPSEPELSVEDRLEQLTAQSEYFDNAIAEIMLAL